MKAVEIARKAAEIVSGDRAETHGDMRDTFGRIAGLWNAYLGDRLEAGCELDPVDVGNLMALLKIARSRSGAVNVDDFVDLAGYAACAGQLATEV